MLKKLFIAILGAGLVLPAARLAAAGDDEAAVRAKLVQAITSSGDDQMKLLNDLVSTSQPKIVSDTLHAWALGKIYIYQSADNGPKYPVILQEQEDAAGRQPAVRVDNGKPVTDDKGAQLFFTLKDLKPLDSEMGTMSAVQQVLDTLDLSDPDVNVRLAAVKKAGQSEKMEDIPILQANLARETNGNVKKAIRTAIATLQLGDSDHPDVQISAARELAKLNSIGSIDDLKSITDDPDANAQVKKAAVAALKSLQNYLSIVNFFGTVFRGLSSGSILLVVALGLAITFGLMGIINMAHGEMIAVGGYTSYVINCIFRTGFYSHVKLPSIGGWSIGFNIAIPGLHAADGSMLYESYFLYVIPLSFITAAFAGLVLERSVIRFLYRRPLDSLLATWGVSLIMQQCFRLVFGANNVQIDSPHWLTGHFSYSDIDFDYNRLFVIVFAILIVIAVWVLLTKTPLGLLMRAVMQNRDMASCMGVSTEKVNMLTFAFGSGLAGLAGAFLSQITNVGPSMGQTWIVGSFMTVVVGGVGNIVGTICSALGIGTVDQVLQQLLGDPVFGTIIVLMMIILFLQWKPEGLFPTRSRSLDN